MYCTYCNHPNADENKFCERCGKRLVKQQVVPVPEIVRPLSEPAHPTAAPAHPVRTTSWARRLASIGSMIVLYCFFLPWILVSCSFDVENKSGIPISGYEIASGSYKITQDLNQFGNFLGAGPSEIPPTNSAYPILALIPLFATMGLLALNGRVSGSVIAILAAGLGIGGMAIFTVATLIYGNELSQSMLLKLQFQVGFWGTWFGFIWLILVAIMTVRQRR